MGNRANIVLVDRDGWQLRYSHWAGCRMLDALLAGPDMAERYIRASSPTPGHGTLRQAGWAGFGRGGESSGGTIVMKNTLLRCGPGITAPELDLTSGVVEAEVWLRKRVFQSYEDSPAGFVSRLVALFGSLEPVSAVTAPMTERPSAREWAGFELACAQVRDGRRAA